jgi:hypothetical protein
MKKRLPFFFLAITLASCKQGSDDPTPAPSFDNQPLTIMIVPQSGPSYILGSGRATYAEYSAHCILNLDGKLSNGKTLSLEFGNLQGVINPGQTNYLKAYLNGVFVKSATGKSVYTASTKKVSGSFSCVFQDDTQLIGSFTDAPIIVR